MYRAIDNFLILSPFLLLVGMSELGHKALALGFSQKENDF